MYSYEFTSVFFNLILELPLVDIIYYEVYIFVRSLSGLWTLQLQ